MKRSFGKYFQLKPIYLLACVALLLAGCGGKKAADDGGDDNSANAQVPVTVTTVSDSSLVDYTTLNATSAYQQKNYVKANAIGYIKKVNVQIGQYVNQGQTLFTIKTKEAQSIGNSINILDTTFKFSGISSIKAAEHGFITLLVHQVGDYVQEGEQLAVISDRSSFGFVMQLPYEMRQAVKMGQEIQLTLPDQRTVTGHIASFMPSVDTASQTQGVLIKIPDDHTIPENLVAKARFVRTAKQNTQSLPKSAVLANETQTEFWVMKLINTTTAVKVSVTKGLETGERVEIVSPKFSPQDKIVVSGNYGLSDTAKVKVVQQ